MAQVAKPVSSRLVIGGRVVGSSKGVGLALCLCGEPVAILGRCQACHEALRRRRLGLPPLDKQEKKRLDAFLEKHQQYHQRCHECGARASDGDHDPRCQFYGQ